MQNRSYPNSVGRHQGTEGWEFIERYDLVGNAQRVAEEASALLRAKTMEPGTTTLILDGSQVALQIHESCGHPSNLDPFLRKDTAFVVNRFLTSHQLDSLMYRSPQWHMLQDVLMAVGRVTLHSPT